MVLNEMGKIADKFWRAIPDHFPFVGLGAYVVMPNHVHGIIVIHVTVGASQWNAPTVTPGKRPNGPKPGSLGAIIGAYKMAVTRRIKEEHNATGIWQRNYYERVIRNEREMENIWRYIEANPAMWRDDTENPARIGPR